MKTRRALALVIVTRMDYKTESFQVRIPAWNTRQLVSIGLDEVPLEIEACIKPGARFYVSANLDVKHASELRLSCWGVKQE